MSAELEIPANAVIIDTSTKKPFDKKDLLDLLKDNKTKIGQCENSEVSIENIIPNLRKAKINLSDVFFKNLALKLGMPFLECSKIKKIFQEEKNRNLLTVLPYQIICKYKVIPLKINGNVMDLAIDNPFDGRVMVVVQYLFSA